MKHFEENIGLAEEPIDNEGTPIAPMFVVWDTVTVARNQEGWHPIGTIAEIEERYFNTIQSQQWQYKLKIGGTVFTHSEENLDLVHSTNTYVVWDMVTLNTLGIYDDVQYDQWARWVITEIINNETLGHSYSVDFDGAWTWTAIVHWLLLDIVNLF
jgi:hypothetical protein